MLVAFDVLSEEEARAVRLLVVVVVRLAAAAAGREAAAVAVALRAFILPAAPVALGCGSAVSTALVLAGMVWLRPRVCQVTQRNTTKKRDRERGKSKSVARVGC